MERNGKQLNRNKKKRLHAAAKKQAARSAIESQFGMKAGALTPDQPGARRGEYNPPGYYRRGALRGVVYTSHIGRTYLT